MAIQGGIRILTSSHIDRCKVDEISLSWMDGRVVDERSKLSGWLWLLKWIGKGDGYSGSCIILLGSGARSD